MFLRGRILPHLQPLNLGPVPEPSPTTLSPAPEENRMSVNGRTKYQAQLDARYARCFQELHERLFGRLDFLFGAITLLGGSAIVYTVTAEHKTLATVLGSMVAASAIIERLVGATERRIQHREMKRRFADLDARADQLTLEQFDGELKRLQCEGPSSTIGGLAMPAYNANLLSEGHGANTQPLSLWEWLVRVLA